MTQLKARASSFSPLKRLGKRFFRLSMEEASFTYRGFPGAASQASPRLERIGRTFLLGYHAALDEPDAERLVRQLSTLDDELRGFAFEGAAMSLALLDLITPWKRDRWTCFFNNGAAAHQYMVYVGVGWALARLQRWRSTHPGLSDPLLSWLAVDGYGFHEGYFHWQHFVEAQSLPARLSGYARRVFDQGLGRSLWFVEGADVGRLARTIGVFSPLRQADLWSGVGLACAYAGGVGRDAIELLHVTAIPYAAHLAQGAAFAAKTRQRAANPTAHTNMACQVLCCLSDDEAAEITDRALVNLPHDERVPAYEVWRQRIQTHFLVTKV
jgi:hypothetical protein